MSEIAKRLGASDLFAKVPQHLVAEIVESTPLVDGQPGESVLVSPVDYFVLLEGAVDLARRQDGVHLASFSVPSNGASPAWLYAVTSQNMIRVIRPSRYLVLDGERIDKALRNAQETPPAADVPPLVAARAEWLHRFPPFLDLTRLETLACAAAAEPITVNAGGDIVRQGQPGQYLYVIEDGRAEVWRSGPSFGPKPVRVATLGPGASFGEEALLQDAARNATVRAVQPCRLLRFDKATFDRYLRERLIEEIDPTEAGRRIDGGKAVLIDCRYDIEFALAHIPGARLMPLDQLRERIRGLDAKRAYIVYCRSGARSRAAAYIMRQNGLAASVLKGGITAWPFAIEGKIGGPLVAAGTTTKAAAGREGSSNSAD
jgi:rhodanese-related sulfurtransferase